ncbi:ABC transporter substrate-binding protein [Candidatus Arthromitus sp. SFB-rat-Yit]|uniref:ABC transporter substrate-binding protein n=1 Tax=Candidatus Arthromitus sp. SFB-rat-Yit TaxID=1041504 RepID=UPI000227A217|nr:ABC transporter substrate-binding protein [Candidatus Arthromitus sp. SFB-rat-Yit]BAK81407.1 putative heme ABC transporter, heme-binding protein IsdE [Candidatus Arthromitus sp. SFB-rat-Yit]
MKFKRVSSIILVSFLLLGCSSVGQASKENDTNSSNVSINQQQKEIKISVASVAISHVLSELNQKIVGRPTTKLELPATYVDIPEIGSSFSPDFEKVLSVGTELLIGDYLFKDKIENSAKQYGIDTFYIDTSSYDKFLRDIEELGKKINKEKEASKLVERFREPLNNLSAVNKDLKVAIISGTSESNMLATEDSYVGSLVKALGVKNIVNEIMASNSDVQAVNNYVNLNLEQLLVNQPDLILTFGHGNIDEANKSLEKLFGENPAWMNLDAVKNNKIYNLDSNLFGTSANINIDKALTELGRIFNG